MTNHASQQNWLWQRRTIWRPAFVCLVGLFFCVAASEFSSRRPSRSSNATAVNAATPEAASASRPRLQEAYGRIPLTFVANQGQTDASVDFLARGAGYTLFLKPTEAVFALAGRRSEQEEDSPRQVSNAARSTGAVAWPRRTVLRMKLLGADGAAAVEGLDELTGKVNYFVGNDQSKWRANVPTFGGVRYRKVYPGIDVVYHGNQQRLEYDFVVAPFADASAISLQFQGSDAVEVEKGSGDLLVRSGDQTIRQQKPFVYQEVEGNKCEIEGRYALRGDGRVGFEVGEYDSTRPLVIDPMFVYSIYLGGTGNDQGLGIAVDSSGSAYVTGFTQSTDFPTRNPFQATNGNGVNVFVTKINAAGSALVYSTYLGGRASANDEGRAIAVDSAGNAYITGRTSSSDFPTTSGAFQTDYRGFAAFVTKLNPSGSALVYSTLLGGGTDANGIALDSLGSAYVIGEVASAFSGGDIPTTPGAFDTTANGNSDAFVTKLKPDGSALIYSTYLGGESVDRGLGIAVDSSGNAYAAGFSESGQFPATAGAFQKTNHGNVDAFVTKLNPEGSALVYSTFLGGAAGDFANGIALDSSRNAYVTGPTSSPDFPMARSGTLGGGLRDAFVAKLNAAGSAVVYSRYLGGRGLDEGQGIAVDKAGNAYITGVTDSADLPTGNAVQSKFGGGSTDAFVAKINGAGSALSYSTYLGGAGLDKGNGIAVDGSGKAYVIGTSDSNNFPTTRQGTRGGKLDSFIAKITTGGGASQMDPVLPDIEEPKRLRFFIVEKRVWCDPDTAPGFMFTMTDDALFTAVLDFPRDIDPDNRFTVSVAGIVLGEFGPGQSVAFSDYGGVLGNLLVNGEGVARFAISDIGPQVDPGNARAFPIKLDFNHDFASFDMEPIASLPPLPSAQLLNISTRLRVQGGDTALIGGFIAVGTEPKKVIIRGIGPSLGNSGVQGAIADPTLELYQGSNLVATNDNWKSNQQAEIEASGIPPSSDLESALVVMLDPNQPYTAILRGKDGSTGIGLVEAYDLAQAANAKLGNISTRGFVDTGNNVMIGGFIVGGSGRGNPRVVVRAIGPSLTSSGISGVLSDPTLELRDGNGLLVAANDNWTESQRVEIEATTIPPNDDRESAIVASLPAGNYTAIVRGKDNTIGVGLVEVYNLP